MKRALETDLLRLLSGDLPPERARGLREQLARDPGLAAAFRRLERAWERLELPPAAAVPLGFSGRVMARVREMPAPRTAGGAAPAGAGTGKGVVPLSWAAAPTWVRASCAAALLCGVLLGAGLGARGTRGQWQARPAGAGVPALTESYWAMVEASESAAATDEAGSASAPALPSARGEDRR
jgi:ferric-dicitrate binding protein FerR (iron transport regulator)